MVATDGSPCADRAVEIGVTLAKAMGATLLLTTVGGNTSLDETRKLARAEGGVPDALELTVNQILNRASERAARLGAPSVRRGWGRFAGLLLGSLSQKLVTIAPCAAIVVP
jgi:nucleotide-binding universal stress UspA family protein